MQYAVVIEQLSQIQKIKEDLQTISNPSILFELRLDLDMTLLAVLKKQMLPLDRCIVTLRSKNEGGNSRLNPFERKKLLEHLLEAFEFKYLDLEVQNDYPLIIELQKKQDLHPNVHFILSTHTFSPPMYEHALKLLNKLKEFNIPLNHPQIVIKFVGRPDDTFDAIKTVKFLHRKCVNAIVLGIHHAADVLRYCGERLRQYIVFSRLDSEGALSIPTLNALLTTTEDSPILTGLLGQSLGHSLSPIIHRILRESLDLNGRYFLFEVKNATNLGDVIAFLKTIGIRGINVTFPYKDAILKFIAEFTPEVLLTNATNTLLFSDSGIVAYNTDVTGFTKFLEANQLDVYSSALIFGAGGAGRSIALSLVRKDFSVIIVNRSSHRIKDFPPALRDKIFFTTLRDYERKMSKFDVDIYINATSLGLKDENPTKLVPIPRATEIILDLTYLPLAETKLIQLAKRNGLKAWDGKEFLFHQAVDAFEIWTGKKINRSACFNKFMRTQKKEEP